MMWYQIKVTEQYQIDYPVIQAGMAGSTISERVATVSELGGIGTISAGYMTPATREQEILKVKARTSRPFSVNLFVPGSFSYTGADVTAMNDFLALYRQVLNLEQPTIGDYNPSTFDTMMDIIIQQHMPICSFTFVMPDERTIQRLEAAEFDAVVVQGSEAGGVMDSRGWFVSHAR
ncbi:TPA: nitronate monooxygenase [Staphylococcus pseudintermedius]